MIEVEIKNSLEDRVDGLTWSANYRTAQDDYGVVYYEGGDSINQNDESGTERLLFQVEVCSSNFDKSKYKAHEVYKLLHRSGNIKFESSYENITVRSYLHSILAETPPIRVGVIDDKMIYTINFVAIVTPYCD